MQLRHRRESPDEIVISTGVADVQRSSLRFTTSAKMKSGGPPPGRTFPELIRNLPGVYSSSETGSFGDARYLGRSKDGPGHDKATVTGDWGNGRNLNFGIWLRLQGKSLPRKP